MHREISNETKQLMERLYAENLSIKEIAKKTNVSYSTAYSYIRLKQKGFASLNQYHQHWIRQRINPETGQPFASLTEYRKYLTKQKQQIPENQELSDLIKKRLEEMRKNQSWLAEQISISRQAVSLYVNRICMPDDVTLKRLYSALEVPYQTIDNLLG